MVEQLTIITHSHTYIYHLTKMSSMIICRAKLKLLFLRVGTLSKTFEILPLSFPVMDMFWHNYQKHSATTTTIIITIYVRTTNYL